MNQVPTTAPDKHRRAGQHPLEFSHRLAKGNAVAKTKLADRSLMMAGALYDDRNCLPHLAQGLEITQQHHGVGEIASVDGRLDVAAREAMLSFDEQSRHSVLS